MPSRSTSSHCISAIAQYSDHNNYHSLVCQDSSDECAHSSSDSPSHPATNFERESDFSPSSSPSMTSDEEGEESEDDLSFSRTLFTSPHAQRCRRRRRRRTRIGNTSNSSFILTLTLPNNLTLQSDFFSLAERQNNNTESPPPAPTTTMKTKKLSNGRQTSIISGRGTLQCEKHVRSSSSRRAS